MIVEPLQRGQCSHPQCDGIDEMHRFVCDFHWQQIPQPLRRDLAGKPGDWTVRYARQYVRDGWE